MIVFVLNKGYTIQVFTVNGYLIKGIRRVGASGFPRKYKCTQLLNYKNFDKKVVTY